MSKKKTYYVLTGTTDPSNGTEAVVLEKDGLGNATKEISAHKAAVLTEDEVSLVKSLGLTLEEISAEDAEALEAQTVSVSVGSDTSGAAPTFDN